jgi:hypothetical protein
MVVHITSPVSVGVGTTSTRNTSDEIKYTEDNTTGLPGVNYRGAICLNDNGDVAGDYDDMIVRCYKANIANPGQSNATITNVDYTNQGAFYGFPVSTYQNGNRPHIIDGDGINGTTSKANGGLNGTGFSDSRWQRLGEADTPTTGDYTNLTYMYSAPRSVIISKYTKTGGWPWSTGAQSGKMDFFGNGSAPQGNFAMQISDSNGTNLLNILNDVKDNNTVKHLIKFTSLDTNSTLSPYTNEKKWMICTLDSGYHNAGYTNTYNWTYTPIYSNFNLSTNGSSQGEAWGNLVIEIIPPWKNSSGSQAWPKPLEFFISEESDNNCGFLIQTQKVVYTNNVSTWSLDIPAQFVRGDCTSGPANGFKFTNKSVSVYPNVPYYVWAWSQNGSSQARDPKVKIINVPGGSISD